METRSKKHNLDADEAEDDSLTTKKLKGKTAAASQKTKTPPKRPKAQKARAPKKVPRKKEKESKDNTPNTTDVITKPQSNEKEILHESNTLEKGHIYFFYRPKVEHHEAHNINDVQKLYMVLKPEKEVGSATLGKNRLFVMTAKRLPDPKTRSRYWAFIETTSHNMEDITKKLEPVDYETKTRGDRHVEGCRPCGSGVYSIIHHLEGKYKSSQHTHLAYVMEIPEKLGEVQDAFQIRQEGSFIITVKNPKATSGRGLGPEKRADYPDSLQEKFGTRKFCPAEPTELLDYDGTEVILIGARDDVVAELGEPGAELEETAEKEEAEEERKHHDHRCTMAEKQVYHTMHMKHKEHPAEPLLEGTWE